MTFERSRRKRKIRIEIVPMIDVTFFLLVFFILFSTFKTHPFGINIDLPAASSAKQNSVQNLTINISRDGDFAVGTKIYASTDLKSLVKGELQKNPDLQVVIKGDKEVPYHYLVEAIDAARQAGGYRLALGVNPVRDGQDGD